MPHQKYVHIHALSGFAWKKGPKKVKGTLGHAKVWLIQMQSFTVKFMRMGMEENKKYAKNMRNMRKICEIMRNYAKLCDYAKLCEIMRIT